ncbi:ABC transporter permease [Faecalicoccus acidiformans]|uniref:ABC transporter permease n=1 Tax=Faecalicoccus acidiformans TaxID=915173 RepID=UPI002357FFB2|nr:ABC transporter permease [Faecalicoccus acidiformans]
MFKSIQYVIRENLSNLFRIYSISKYELLADMRDSKFGIFWNFASPAIQVFTYWLIFGVAWDRKPIEVKGISVPYLPWLVVGYAIWWFIQPCIQKGCSAIFSKTGVITKMKFPVSVLPATIVCKELFNHGCMLVIMFVTLFLCGYTPNINWLWILYYMFCAFVFSESVSLILSVLTMLWRDIKKLVTSLIRMFMYFSPVIWECSFSSSVPFAHILNSIMKLNPVYYIIQGYRDAIFYGQSVFDHPLLTLYFWGVVLILFAIGCALMFKFKKKFIDLI